MYDIKVMIPGGFQIIKCYGDDLRVYNSTVPQEFDASDIIFNEPEDRGPEPVVVHDLLSGNTGFPAPRIHEGHRSVIIARITNRYERPEAVVCDSELFVVNSEGKTVSTHRT